MRSASALMSNPLRITVIAMSLLGCRSLPARYEAHVQAQRDAQGGAPEVVVTEADLAHLPAPVATYVRRSGAVGKPRVHDFAVEFDAELRRGPEQAPLPTAVEQVSFVDRPARFFFLRTRMFGLPVTGLHAYVDGSARMDIRLAGVFDVASESGAALDRAETVTVLNDFCILAPAVLIDPRFTWEAVDDRSARVSFTTGQQRVTATLFFDEHGDLVDFASDDRHALEDDGFRWTTPVGEYAEFDGRRVAARGEAIWHYADRPDFTYGTFRVRSIRYNVSR